MVMEGVRGHALMLKVLVIMRKRSQVWMLLPQNSCQVSAGKHHNDWQPAMLQHVSSPFQHAHISSKTASMHRLMQRSSPQAEADTHSIALDATTASLATHCLSRVACGASCTSREQRGWCVSGTRF